MQLLGLRTLIYRVEDLNEAKKWYSEFLGKKPYFDEVFYVGFEVGGFELGLSPVENPVEKGENVETYLGVKNLEISHQQAIELGVQVRSEPMDVGDGIKVSTYYDPFGNVIGLIENPHFKLSTQ